MQPVEMAPVDIIKGDGPVILGLPHTGTWIADKDLARLNARGQELADTDWHIDKLYADLLPQATQVRATFHRYLIDANRDPSGQSLYPGQNTTALCPLTDFEGQEIYHNGHEPTQDEIELRREKFHTPYHAALEAEIERVKAKHGIAIVYDCHSIRSKIPFLFENQLPDFNIGTNGGETCAPEIEAAVLQVCQNASGYNHVLNGRFKGGWTTRQYGDPAQGCHAIQMELAQASYMQESAPWTYLSEKADRLRHHLKTILEEIERIALLHQRV